MKKNVLIASVILSLLAVSTAPVLAFSTASSTPNSNTTAEQCIKLAKQSKDDSVISANAAHKTAVNQAKTIKESALATAHALTNKTEKVAAIKSAITTYNASIKSATMSFKSAKEATQKKYTLDKEQCKK